MKTRFLFSALLLAAGVVLIEEEPAQAAPHNTNFVSIHLLETNFVLSGLLADETPMRPNIGIEDARLDTNLISIHLLADDFPCGSLTGEAPMPTKIRIVDEPFYSDADFLAWNQENHTFTISEAAEKRMAEKWPAWRCPAGIPFVLMASGSPIYVGVFGSHFSSVSTAVPTAISYPDVTRERIGTQTILTTNATYEIQRNYPFDEPAGGPWDPRNDKRIVAAVEKLFGTPKLETLGQQKSAPH